jgi:hypothetical protein
MKFAGLCGSIVVAALAAGVIAFTFAGETTAPESATLAFTRAPATISASATPAATPTPHTWLDALGALPFGRAPMLLTCLDRDANDVLEVADDVTFYGLALQLSPEDACINPIAQADYFDAVAPSDFGCGATHQPVYLVVIGGGGSNLLDANQGDSMGLTTIVRNLRDRAEAANVRLAFTLSSGAIIGADMAQTSLEDMLTAHIRARLEAVPCARAVIIGHSHGGVTVTSISAALEEQFSERMLGVLVDRSNVLYDRPADEMPSVTRIINVFQTNEGWHGEALKQPNVTDIDASDAIAPIAPHDGGGGTGTVTHRSLDDSPAVQARIVEEILAWLSTTP